MNPNGVNYVNSSSFLRQFVLLAPGTNLWHYFENFHKTMVLRAAFRFLYDFGLISKAFCYRPSLYLALTARNMEPVRSRAK